MFKFIMVLLDFFCPLSIKRDFYACHWIAVGFLSMHIQESIRTRIISILFCN